MYIGSERPGLGDISTAYTKKQTTLNHGVSTSAVTLPIIDGDEQ